MIVALVLLLIAGVFTVYAVRTQYISTDPTLSVQKRVWASVIAGAGALGAALVQWIHGITGP